jgi:CRISPR-associated protein Csd2
MNFGRSIDPICPREISITRMAVTREEDIEKERTIGKKNIVPYGLYRTEGYVSACLAEQTGFNEEDLALLWDALINMFDHDHSAARGKMCARRLIVFKHDSKIGNAPAHKLFETVRVKPCEGKPPRSFDDYKDNITTPLDGVLKGFSGVTVQNLL